MAKLATVEFKGETYEYDPTALKSYAVLKAITNPANPAGFFKAIERLFAGHDVEYAEKLGGDFEEIGALITAISEQEGEAVKN